MEASNFCRGVQILIARMESNPEDFEEGEFDYARDKYRENRRFRYVRKCLEEVFKNPNSDKWTEWRYLTPEERDALMAAFIKMERNKFDKTIMDILLQGEEKEEVKPDFNQLIRNTPIAPLPPPYKTFHGTLAEHAIHQEHVKAQIEFEIKKRQHDDMLDAQRLTLLGKLEKWIEQ